MTNRPIRVAMIGQKGYPPIHGGIEKHVAELAVRLGRLGVATEINLENVLKMLDKACE